MKQEYIANSPSQTKKLGKKLAEEILNPVRDSEDIKEPKSQRISNGVKKKPKKRAFVIGLAGELGSGKTTFLQGFAKGLGIKEKILSPTFVIIKKFHLIAKQLQEAERLVCVSSFKFQEFYHIDCYRLKKSKELLDLGFQEVISNPKNIVVIEWADRVRKIMPKDAVWIKFKFIDKRTRKITILK